MSKTSNINIATTTTAQHLQLQHHQPQHRSNSKICSYCNTNDIKAKATVLTTTTTTTGGFTTATPPMAKSAKAEFVAIAILTTSKQRQQY